MADPAADSAVEPPEKSSPSVVVPASQDEAQTFNKYEKKALLKHFSGVRSKSRVIKPADQMELEEIERGLSKVQYSGPLQWYNEMTAVLFLAGADACVPTRPCARRRHEASASFSGKQYFVLGS